MDNREQVSMEEEHVDPWISLITLGVRDLERSRRFFQDGLGWPLSAASTEDVTCFRTGGVVLARYPRELLAADADISPEGAGFPGIALAHNVATRALVDAALEAAVAAGGTLRVQSSCLFCQSSPRHYARSTWPIPRWVAAVTTALASAASWMPRPVRSATVSWSSRSRPHA